MPQCSLVLHIPQSLRSETYPPPSIDHAEITESLNREGSACTRPREVLTSGGRALITSCTLLDLSFFFDFASSSSSWQYETSVHHDAAAAAPLLPLPAIIRCRPYPLNGITPAATSPSRCSGAEQRFWAFGCERIHGGARKVMGKFNTVLTVFV
nr:hypothetical protein Iba_chr02dCG7910 [Ipomoea batatas]GMC67076.1 hypothetical protein Iba_chr02eCG11620 [Ipomoea batatas]